MFINRMKGDKQPISDLFFGEASLSCEGPHDRVAGHASGLLPGRCCVGVGAAFFAAVGAEIGSARAVRGRHGEVRA